MRHYAALVEHALGLDSGGHCVQPEPQASIYLPLTARLTRFPDRDVALLWDDQRGWAAATENPTGGEFTLLASLPDDPLPPPRVVAQWVEQLFSDEWPGLPTAPGPSADATDDLALRLTGYATPALDA